MLGWLNGLKNFFGGGLAVIWNTFLSVLASVYSYLAASQNGLIAFTNSIYTGLWRLALAYGQFTSVDYPRFVTWVSDTFSRVLASLSYQISNVIADINALSHRTDASITYVQQQEGLGISALIKWIISTIFDPLNSLISGVLNWIDTEGKWILSLLTDLEKLADLIMAFIWSGWLVLFRKYMKQIVAFVLTGWKSWIPDVTSVIEDILVSLF